MKVRGLIVKDWDPQTWNEDTQVGSDEVENLEPLSHSEPSLLEEATLSTYFT